MTRIFERAGVTIEMSMQLARAAGLAAAVAVGIGIAGTAAAQNERVAVQTVWTVFTPSDPRECYIASPPTVSPARRGGRVGLVERGEILLFVSFRQQDK